MQMMTTVCARVTKLQRSYQKKRKKKQYRLRTAVSLFGVKKRTSCSTNRLGAPPLCPIGLSTVGTNNSHNNNKKPYNLWQLTHGRVDLVNKYNNFAFSPPRPTASPRPLDMHANQLQCSGGEYSACTFEIVSFRVTERPMWWCVCQRLINLTKVYARVVIIDER